MQALALVAILWLGASTSFLPTNEISDRFGTRDFLAAFRIKDALPDRISQVVGKLQRRFCPSADGIQLDDLLRLPTDVILNIVPRVFSNLISEALLDRFDVNCLRAALRVENAPPGQIFLVIEKLLGSDQLRSSQIFDRYVLEALELAYDVGHCDLIPLLSDHLRNSPFYRGISSSPNFDRASCDDVDRLAALPLEKLLGMHALPKSTFLKVIDIKYRRSGYGSFFRDRAWYSNLRSRTVMSHALHLYEQLNGEFDFEPVPFGRIASTQNLSEPTLRSTLEDTPPDDLWCIFSYLQLVLKPGCDLKFWQSSDCFRTQFLAEACLAGRLDWIKFMLEHDVWRNDRLSNDVIYSLGTLGRDGHNFALLYDDLLEDVDPALSVFELVFHHQMRLRSSYLQLCLLRKMLLRHTTSPQRLADPARQIACAYKSETLAGLRHFLDWIHDTDITKFLTM